MVCAMLLNMVPRPAGAIHVLFDQVLQTEPSVLVEFINLVDSKRAVVSSARLDRLRWGACRLPWL